MQGITPLQCLHGCANRQASGIAFTENVWAFVVPNKLSVTGLLAEQELLPALGLDNLHTDQMRADTHGDEEQQHSVLHIDVALFVRESLGCEVGMMSELAFFQHPCRSLGRFDLLAFDVVVCLLRDAPDLGKV